MTRTGAIGSALSANWSLTGNLAASKIKFPVKEWFDSDFPTYPQITVTYLSDRLKFFSHNGTLKPNDYQRFTVNIWMPVPQGAKGLTEASMVESMREEVYRIVIANSTAIGNFQSIVPLDTGLPRHELNVEPKCFRYELTLLSTETK